MIHAADYQRVEARAGHTVFCMPETFGVVEVGERKAWQFADKATAMRYAAG